MQRLTEIALANTNRGVFTKPEVACWLDGTPQRQFALIKRALDSGQILHLRRGLYCLAPQYLPNKIDPLVLAQRIYGPSYISLETALSHHGWIPEAVFAITSASFGRSREFATPLGHFTFTRIPQGTFYAEVTRIDNGAGQCFLLASPLKALADYVYVHKRDWTSSRPIIESLRVDERLLHSVEAAAFDSLWPNYSSRRVRRFLQGLRKDLHR